MKILIAPASFKGTLSADDAAQAMCTGVLQTRPDIECVLRPLADGGEGTLAAVLTASGGTRSAIATVDADGVPLSAETGLLPDGTVLIESARVVGFGRARLPLAQRSTFGLGLLLRACIAQGHRRFAIALGGTSTNDGGAGLLAGLGARLLDVNDGELSSTPENLLRIARVDISTLDTRIADCSFEIWSDVDNPLIGTNGASYVFAPQKGARLQDCAQLDAALAHWAHVADAAFAKRLSAAAGGGAAGGLGYALQLLGGRVRSGADAVAERIGIRAALAGCRYAITGEGRADGQTLQGKAPLALARAARHASVPAMLLAGDIDPAAAAALAREFASVASVSDLVAVATDPRSDLAYAAAALAQRFDDLAG